MQKYRKKPIDVEALQYDGTNIQSIWDWVGADRVYGPVEDDPCAYIETPEGRMQARPGDWIIKGAHDELYPIKPEIFADTYVPVRDADFRSLSAYMQNLMEQAKRFAARRENGK